MAIHGMLKRIDRIAKRYKLKVIYDAACFLVLMISTVVF